MRFRHLILLSALTLSLFAYTDSDLDGVDDADDRCPNTPISDLVDETGCTIESLESPHHFSLQLGLNHHAGTTTQTAQLDYYYHDFTMELYGAFDYETDSDESGFNDTWLWAYYALYPADALQLRFGAGAIFPAYDPADESNRIDYGVSVSLSYAQGRLNPFGGYSYTWVDDEAPEGSGWAYRNIHAFYMGLGYFVGEDLYVSAAYNFSQSIYEDNKDLQSASADVSYTIDSHWFARGSYTRALGGLEYDNYFSVQIGYYF